MELKIYKARIGWWVYAIMPLTVLSCMLGPVLTKSDYWLGIILSVPFCILISFLIATTKYAVRGNEFGVKCASRWTWFPIGKIRRITRTVSILSAPALSVHRIAIKFSDRSILKSSAPLEISPKDCEGFIHELLEVNPDIEVS